MMLYQPQHTVKRWYPAQYKAAVVSVRDDILMMRADMVYRRSLVESDREVYLVMSSNRRVAFLKPVYGVLRHRAPELYIAKVWNVVTLDYDEFEVRPGQLLTVVI